MFVKVFYLSTSQLQVVGASLAASISFNYIVQMMFSRAKFIKLIFYTIFSLLIFIFGVCRGTPTGVKPVSNFELERYLGKWHEIARLDHSFERGLSQVSAEYRLRKDGSVTVINRGYDLKSERWKEAMGVARFVGIKSVGALEVSFFRPFYGSYNIILLDHDNYNYALVCSSSRKYLWILARQPRLDSNTLSKLISTAQNYGFETEKLIFPEHRAQ